MAGTGRAQMSTTDRKLGGAIFLNVVIAIAEISGGIVSGSMALVSDAVHNVADTSSLVLSLVALKMSRLDNSERLTFGWKRAEILAALINGSVLVGVVLFMLAHLIKRVLSPVPIDGALMLWIAPIGLVGNVGAMLLLKGDAKHNLNIRSSYLHLLSDSLSSVAVVAGGIMIVTLGWAHVDTILSFMIILVVLWQTLRLTWEAVAILMDAVPKHLDVRQLQADVEKVPRVKNMHHLHVRQVSDYDIHLQAHIELAEDIPVSVCAAVQRDIEKILQEGFQIRHSTLQFEWGVRDSTSLIKNSKG